MFLVNGGLFCVRASVCAEVCVHRCVCMCVCRCVLQEAEMSAKERIHYVLMVLSGLHNV